MLISIEPGAVLYQQIFEQLGQHILTGRLSPGQRLPSTRALAGELGVSRNVVLLAYEQLMAEGYAEAVVGAGTFVSPQLPELTSLTKGEKIQRGPSSVSPRLSPFAQRALEQLSPQSYPSSVLPFDFRYGLTGDDPSFQRQWRRVLMQAASSRARDYADPRGYLPLREALAQYLVRQRGLDCEPEQLHIVTGSQQALDLTSRVLLAPHAKVLIEDPCYQGARKCFAAAGAKLLPRSVDDEGLCSDEMPQADLCYVTPSHQFPTGAVMPLARRLALLHWAEAKGAYIVEDDYDSAYRYEGRPIAAIQGLDKASRVIYIGTFSKTLFPAMRLGFLVLPKALCEAFQALKWLSDRHSSLLEQIALSHFIEQGSFERHLRRTRARYAARREALLQALSAHLGDQIEIKGSNAGVHVLVWLKRWRAHEAKKLTEAARERGLGLYPVSAYYTEPPERLGLLFGYASLSEAEIAEGVKRFAALVAA